MNHTIEVFGSPTVTDWLGAPIAPGSLHDEFSRATSLDDHLRVVLWDWAHRGAHATLTLARMGEVAIRFARRLTATGVTAWNDVDTIDCKDFIDARTATSELPSINTRHWRRSTIRCTYRSLRALGEPVGDPTLDLELPPRTAATTRPVTDDELTLLRTAATLSRSSNARIALALAETSAVTSEIPHIRVRDLDDPAAPTSVTLPGTARHDPRTGVLSPWGQAVIARHATTLDDPDDRLAYRGQARAGSVSPQASACNHLGSLLRVVGLHREPDIRPNSIRHWAGRALYDSGQPIDVVARRLGFRSLDATADAIALDWRTDTEDAS